MQGNRSNSESLSGSIERVVFHNPDNGFAVLKVEVDGRRDAVSIVGHVPLASPGEFIEAEGRWVVDRQHGRQFKADLIRTAHPATAEGIEKYLASGLVKGIGPSLASRLVGAFGARLFEIIAHEPQRLTELRGIGRKRSQQIVKRLQQQRAIHAIMVFLHEHGLGSARATRVYQTYGDQAIAAVKQNPYQLAQDIRGIGFKAADTLAGKLGIDRQSPLRARAGVAQVLKDMTSEGHCALPEQILIEKAGELLELEASVVRAALAHELQAGRLIRERIADQDWIYLAYLYAAETRLADVIRSLTAGSHPLPNIDVEKAIAWVERRVRIKLAATQKEAVKLAAQHKVLIITGGPGVGKTTLIDSLLQIFAAKDLECMLCAPTGRAAKRLSEATRREAKTIHRLLEFDSFEFVFKRNANYPLDTDVLLIDEVSMVDLPLASAVLQAVPARTAVILVGDVDQLPSVGPGTVLSDLIACSAIPTVRLTEVFRQAAQSRIIRAAYQVNNGQVPDLARVGVDDDFFFTEAENPEAAADMLVRIVTERIPQRFGLDPVHQVQVITPMHRGLLGARNLNEVLQARLNPPNPAKGQVERIGYIFRVGDKVLQTVNNYKKEVFNGDLGLIVKVDREEGLVGVNFDGRVLEYAFGDLDELIPAYAMTIHKSQGSEFPAVVIPVHTQHYTLLQRNLLYTAITRGKRLVVLVGTTRAVTLAVRRAQARKRYSGLRWRLQHL